MKCNHIYSPKPMKIIKSIKIKKLIKIPKSTIYF